MPPSGAAPTKGKGLLYAGIGLIVVGLGAGAALFSMSGSAKEETVKKFARAPVGCTTTLEFDKSAVFTLYVETKGKVDDVGGDCESNGSTYDLADDDLPRVTLTLLDDDDNEVGLDSAGSPSYDAGGFRGQAIEKVRIERPGTYRLTVESDVTDFAIAIGGDPEADGSTMKTAGIGAAAAGLVLGGLLVFLAKRKKGSPGTPVGTWQPAAAGVPGWQPQGVPGYQPQQPQHPQQQPTYPQQQPPSYAPQPPTYPPQQQPPTYTPPPSYNPPPQAPPQPSPPPQDPGWGTPQQ